jgi:hypothetical protein
MLQVEAATFSVSDVTSFQNALTTAASNGQDDLIHVAAGIYNISSTLSHSSGEDRTLTIEGAGSGATILDGGNLTQIIAITSTQIAADVIITKLAFQNGSTIGNGGALNVQTHAASITLSNCVVSDSTATASDSVGGGASLYADSGTITVTGCTFSRNSSAGNVGGLYAATNTGTINLSSSTFNTNSVANSGGSEYYGDGGGAMLYSEGTSRISVNGNMFNGNTASGGSNPDGGGMMTYQLGAASSVSIQGNTFNGNQAGLGGGGCFIRFNASGTAECHDNTFRENRTLVSGGAGFFIYINDGTLNLTRNSFTDNDAASNGSGAWIELLAGTAVISENTFTGNSTDENGGGLGIGSDEAGVTISRNIFDGNTAGNVGGGISYAVATDQGSLNTFNNTFYGNTATGDGGGLYAYFEETPVQATLRNNIMWNDVPNEYSYSFGSGSTTVVMIYSVAGNSSTETWFGTGCIASDPLFANAAGGKYTLTWAGYPRNDATKSPCIDTGDPTSGLDTDGTRADMGAIVYEQDKQSAFQAVSGLINLLLLN